MKISDVGERRTLQTCPEGCDQFDGASIAGITGGTLFQNDGVTVIASGTFITFAQAQAGVKFLPSANSTAAEHFDVESSQDGNSVAAQSGLATSTITVTPVNDPPTDLLLSESGVVENEVGVVVGDLTVDDPDVADSNTWEVNDSRFEIVAGQLRLVAGQSVNFEKAAAPRNSRRRLS